MQYYQNNKSIISPFYNTFSGRKKSDIIYCTPVKAYKISYCS